jgi:hypothetical protein
MFFDSISLSPYSSAKNLILFVVKHFNIIKRLLFSKHHYRKKRACERNVKMLLAVNKPGWATGNNVKAVAALKAN